MEIEYDPDKEIANILKHGMSLEIARVVDWSIAMIQADTRWFYGEARCTAVVPVLSKHYVIVFTDRRDRRRIISVRRANHRERRRYVRFLGTSDG